MATTQGSYFLGTDFANLKSRVKNEMNRRNGNGSLAGYAAASYDFTVVATAGNIIKEEHFDKIRDLMANINPAGVSLPAKAQGDIIVAINALEGNMTTFEAKPRGERGTSDCASACTGTCVTQCTTTCDGCSGCSGCGDACSSGCTSCTSCTDACSGCTNACSGCTGCGGACGSNCSGGCTGYCTAVCAAGCTGCGGACSSTCTGCTGSTAFV